MTRRRTARPGVDVSRWPRIRRALRVDTHLYEQSWLWEYWSRDWAPEVKAAGYEEWADFHEWELTQRPDADIITRTWTDSMCYVLRRRATLARGEDPGERVDQCVRRPDLFGDLYADHDEDHEPVSLNGHGELDHGRLAEFASP